MLADVPQEAAPVPADHAHDAATPDAGDPGGAAPTLASPATAPSPLRSLGMAFWLSTAWIAALVVVAIFRDLLPFRDPEALGIRTGEVARFEAPGWNAWFGADGKGRDLLALVAYGARPALVLGATVTVVAAAVGTAVGVTAGYLRGRVDTVITVAIDIALAFPVLVLLIAVRSTFGNSMTVFVVIFTITSIPAYARIVRGATLSLAERGYIAAAESMGATRTRVVFHELLPNLALPVLSFAFIGFALVVIAEGGLAFIGLSLAEPTWGKLIAEGSGEIRSHAHLALVPATVMFVTILAFNLAGDALRAISSPRVVATQRRITAAGVRQPAGGDAVLHIADLHTTLHTPSGDIEAVHGVSIDVAAGEALGVVGESGSGKTMILRSIVGSFPLAAVTRSGTVDVAGVDMLRSDERTVRATLGRKIGMVSQNPLTALNPVRRIDSQIIEPMIVHAGLSKSEARARALQLMGQVGIPAPERRLREYPHQLSGGMRQRVTIVIALANQPELLLADEPTTALDVTVQAQILRLLSELQRSRSMAMVLVTHNLAVVKEVADRVAIVYAGEIVESGTTEAIFRQPGHHYTVALMRSMPSLDMPSHSVLATIEGAKPSLADPPPGCRFAARCPAAREVCRTTVPPRAGDDAHWYRCHFPVRHVPVRHGDGDGNGG